MKVFLSSVISGMEELRDSAAKGALALGHQVTRSEDFGASPDTPQQTCLAGVRAAEVVILLLGGHYGSRQPSGLSATHEEYREAKDRCPILVFIRDDVEREPDQETFIKEVQEWSSGQYTETFSNAEQLSELVVRRLHQLEIAHAAGRPDYEEMLSRADELIPDRSAHGGPELIMVVCSGPRQQLLRPSQIEGLSLSDAILGRALLGDLSVLTPQEGTQRSIQSHALVLAQESGSIYLDELGSVRITHAAIVNQKANWSAVQALIEEDVKARLQRALRFAGWILDTIDPVHRVTDFALEVALLSGGYLPWKTRNEQDRDPGSAYMSRGGDRIIIHLSPPHGRRAALIQNALELAEDLTVLLRRELRQSLQ